MLSVENVDLHYGAAQALRSVSLTAETGKIACVMGRNGVGKTSLMRAIVGQKNASRGRILWNGEDVTRARRPSSARGAASRSCRRGARSSRCSRSRRTCAPASRRSSAARHTIPDDVFSLFPVLAQMLRRRGGDLSGGQQQQLAIGRALVMRPKLLVLDEPTEGIQPSIIKDIGRAIAYLRQSGEMAIVLVEQYFDFAKELADRIFVMDRGEVVLAGDATALDEQAVRRYLTV